MDSPSLGTNSSPIDGSGAPDARISDPGPLSRAAYERIKSELAKSSSDGYYKSQVLRLKERIADKNGAILKVTTSHSNTAAELTETKSQLGNTRQQLQESNWEVAETKWQLNKAKEELKDTKEKLEETRRHAEETKYQADENKRQADENKRQADENKREAEKNKRQFDKANRQLERLGRQLEENKRCLEETEEMVEHALEENKERVEAAKKQAGDERQIDAVRMNQLANENHAYVLKIRDLQDKNKALARSNSNKSYALLEAAVQIRDMELELKTANDNLTAALRVSQDAQQAAWAANEHLRNMSHPLYKNRRGRERLDGTVPALRPFAPDSLSEAFGRRDSTAWGWADWTDG
ncbi:hypothetical protein B0T25DRAFT_597573 [Lasiosphaeria hispida]|uniref:Uncharacterized protein n=1 Tax=Lasiosphaeria hispida TaxID=260671 RepID=A0AAJ0HW16_9PEZI|nr:hypothetical protein B0T25DRAFT_597573 [Lasiosphaeria hispida]